MAKKTRPAQDADQTSVTPDTTTPKDSPPSSARARASTAAKTATTATAKPPAAPAADTPPAGESGTGKSGVDKAATPAAPGETAKPAAPAAAKTTRTGSATGPAESEPATPAARSKTSTDSATATTGENAPATTATAPSAATTAAPREVVTERRTGIFPMLLGGLAAGAIGFATADYLQQPAAPPDLSGLETRVAALAARLDGIPAPVDLSPLEIAQQNIRDSIDILDTRLADHQTALGAMQQQLDALIRQAGSPEMSEQAVALARQSLEAQLAGLRSEVGGLVQDAQVRKAEAEAAERATAIGNALSGIRLALENGTPFADLLGVLDTHGISLPDGLRAAAVTGAPTRTDLQSSFPPAARAALAAARKAGEARDGGGVGAFLKTQFGVRSLEPQQGDSPDAILSRTEAALQAGNLDQVLAGLDTLSGASRDQMAAWRARVQTRLDADTAVQALTESQN